MRHQAREIDVASAAFRRWVSLCYLLSTMLSLSTTSRKRPLTLPSPPGEGILFPPVFPCHMSLSWGRGEGEGPLVSRENKEDSRPGITFAPNRSASLEHPCVCRRQVLRVALHRWKRELRRRQGLIHVGDNIRCLRLRSLCHQSKGNRQHRSGVNIYIADCLSAIFHAELSAEFAI